MDHRPRFHRGLVAWLLLASALWFTSCASFSSRQLPQQDLQALEQAGRLAAITYDLTEAGSGGFMTPVAASFATNRVEPLFRRLFVESKRQAEPSHLHLDMYFRETARNPGVTLGLALVFICTLGLFPAYGEDELYLEVKVRRDGECIRQYVYVDRMYTWMHWFMLPWAFSNDPQEMSDLVLDNMILNLVHDLRRDLPEFVPGS